MSGLLSMLLGTGDEDQNAQDPMDALALKAAADKARVLQQTLQANATMPQGRMVGGIYVPASPLSGLAAFANNVAADIAGKKAAALSQQAQAKNEADVADYMRQLSAPYVTSEQVTTQRPDPLDARDAQATADFQPTTTAVTKPMLGRTLYQEQLRRLGAAPPSMRDTASQEIMKLMSSPPTAKSIGGDMYIDPEDGQVKRMPNPEKTALEWAKLKQSQDDSNQRAEDRAASLDERRQSRLLRQSLSGDDEVDPKQVETLAQLYAWYKRKPPSDFAMAKNPIIMAAQQRAVQINPDYDAKNYGMQDAALRTFTSGKKGDRVRSFGVANYHLDTLQQLAEALNNGNLPAANRLSNLYKAQTGKTAPTNFDTAKKIVADEVAKAIIGNGAGTGMDREEYAKPLDRADNLQQLSGAISTLRELMNGQLTGLRNQ